MFTFGREHEKKCDAAYVRNCAQLPLLIKVIDSTRDLIEETGSEAIAGSALPGQESREQRPGSALPATFIGRRQRFLMKFRRL
jgi:hypothetical protein